jgi:Protein of unknown function (DUF2911)
MRTLTSLAGLVCLFAAASLAQDSQTTYCEFTDGGEVSMRYNPVVKDQPRNGRVWSPGITLFVQVPLTLAGAQIPLGAYTVHMIPDKKNWTLIVSKNVTSGSQYNSADDVARAPMEIGEIPEPTKQLQLAFAHMGAKQCSLRVYYQKAGAFVDFMEK